MGKLVLIDGHSILNRAFYGVPELTNSKGLHTNAVYGFLNIMFRVIEDEGADYLAVAFDLKEPTFRHKMYAAYKGTRKPMPQELHEQVPVMKEVLTAMGVPILTKAGYEADDILGTIAKRCAAEGVEEPIRRRVLEQILYHLGRWVYLIDAADDLKKDAESGNYNPVALRYGLKDGTWDPESRHAFAVTLDHSIHQMAAAFELWNFGVWTTVLQTTFYAGLFRVGHAVLEGPYHRRDRKNLREIEETT